MRETVEKKKKEIKYKKMFANICVRVENSAGGRSILNSNIGVNAASIPKI